MIYLDSCVVIYFVERHPQWGDEVEHALEAADAPLAISALVKLECMIGPLRRRDATGAAEFESFFARCVALNLPEVVYRQAAILRADFRLGTPDALHLACAQHAGCSAFWTNDDRLRRASGGLAVRIAH